MVEDENTDWRALLEKWGLHQAADIIEKYGIDSETDLSSENMDLLFDMRRRRIFMSPFRRILFVVIESSFS